MASLKIIDQRLQQNALELSLNRALLSGKVVSVSDTEAHIFVQDDLLVQKLIIDGGNRTPLMHDPLFTVTGEKVDFSVTAMLTHNLEGDQVWARELTQEGVL